MQPCSSVENIVKWMATKRTSIRSGQHICQTPAALPFSTFLLSKVDTQWENKTKREHTFFRFCYFCSMRWSDILTGSHARRGRISPHGKLALAPVDASSVSASADYWNRKWPNSYCFNGLLIISAVLCFCIRIYKEHMNVLLSVFWNPP